MTPEAMGMDQITNRKGENGVLTVGTQVIHVIRNTREAKIVLKIDVGKENKTCSNYRAGRQNTRG